MPEMVRVSLNAKRPLERGRFTESVSSLTGRTESMPNILVTSIFPVNPIPATFLAVEWTSLLRIVAINWAVGRITVRRPVRRNSRPDAVRSRDPLCDWTRSGSANRKQTGLSACPVGLPLLLNLHWLANKEQHLFCRHV